MSKINPRLVYWIGAVHKRPDLSASHRDILTYLAVMRLDYGTGKGYCSVRMLAEGRGWHEATVRRALDLAQKGDPPLLARTRRGHRISSEVVVASEWQVVYPPMPTAQGNAVGSSPTAHPCEVGADPTAQSAGPNRAEVETQPRTGAPPTGIEASTGNESSTSLSRALDSLASAVPALGEREIGMISDHLKDNPEIPHPGAYLRAVIANSEAAEWAQQILRGGRRGRHRRLSIGDQAKVDADALIAEIATEDGSGPRSEACRRRIHKPAECAYGIPGGWCTCICHSATPRGQLDDAASLAAIIGGLNGHARGNGEPV